MGRNLSIYVHIPFCKRKCLYCDFLSFAGLDCQANYTDALLRDIQTHGGTEIADPTVTSVFIGGGTPSLMPEGTYERLFSAIRERFSLAENAEITIECNPGTVTGEKLAEYRRAGINRLSFGAQSADDAELRMLGRIHTWNEVCSSVSLAREACFDNINIDLMMNLPGQTKERVLASIDRTVALGPEHISAYSLILEEGTQFYERYAEHPELLPDEDAAAETYEAAVDRLARHGYAQYEISNFAKPGFACRHNIGYWKREEYLGIGLGAASLIGTKRFSVTRDLSSYMKELSYESIEELTDRDIRNETVMLKLRMNEGIDLRYLADCFGSEYAERIGERTEQYEKQGLVEKCGSVRRFTVRGMLVSNSILADLME